MEHLNYRLAIWLPLTPLSPLSGITPLHLAAKILQGKDLIQLLLSQPEIKAKELDKGNDTPQDIARRHGRCEKYFEILDSCFI